jgi:dUTP pyrophosphatase
MNLNTSKKSQTTTSKKPSSTSKKASKKSSKSSTTAKPLEIKCVLSEDNSAVPKHATDYSAGIDLHVLNIKDKDEKLVNSLDKDTNYIVHTGVSIAIPEGYFGMLVPRSSWAKKGMTILNSPGIIDSDYRGELMIMVKFSSSVTIATNDRIAQLIIVPYAKTKFVKVEKLPETLRGEGGFGSTGK